MPDAEVARKTNEGDSHRNEGQNRSVEKNRLKIEIYEGDPFGSACCGPGPLVTSAAAAEKLRKMLLERSEIVERLTEEFKDMAIVKRDLISQKRSDYPDYVLKLMYGNRPLPYVFVDGDSVVVGKFPSYDELTALIRNHSGQKRE